MLTTKNFQLRKNANGRWAWHGKAPTMADMNAAVQNVKRLQRFGTEEELAEALGTVALLLGGMFLVDA